MSEPTKLTERDDWKRERANASEDGVLDHPLVLRAMEEFAGNMRFEFDGLPRYGLMKIASVVAQVARARALGFDPELLRLSPGEANEALLAVARSAVAVGKPVLRVDPDGSTTRLD